MSLIGLALAVAATVLAFRRDFKEAAGVLRGRDRRGAAGDAGGREPAARHRHVAVRRARDRDPLLSAGVRPRAPDLQRRPLPAEPGAACPLRGIVYFIAAVVLGRWRVAACRCSGRSRRACPGTCGIWCCRRSRLGCWRPSGSTGVLPSRRRGVCSGIALCAAADLGLCASFARRRALAPAATCCCCRTARTRSLRRLRYTGPGCRAGAGRASARRACRARTGRPERAPGDARVCWPASDGRRRPQRPGHRARARRRGSSSRTRLDAR